MGKKSQFDFNGTDFQRLTAQPSPTLTVLCVQLFGHSALVYSSLQRSFSKVSNFSAAGACADKLAGKKANPPRYSCRSVHAWKFPVRRPTFTTLHT